MALMRLNAYLARAGVASRRGADDLIKAGRVAVNGEPGQLNTFVASRDRVELDGRRVELQPLAYVLLHKPAGVVTTARDPQGRRTVVDLVTHPTRIVPVGRLDADTTGALLLTNDGELAHVLAHPRYEVEKVYVAEVEGEPSDEALERPPRRRRARRRAHGPGAGAAAWRRADRALAPRGPQAPGQADAGRGRPPRFTAPPQSLRGPDARRARARRMARARALRGRSAQDDAASAAAWAIRSFAAFVQSLSWFSLNVTLLNSAWLKPVRIWAARAFRWLVSDSIWASMPV